MNQRIEQNKTKALRQNPIFLILSCGGFFIFINIFSLPEAVGKNIEHASITIAQQPSVNTSDADREALSAKAQELSKQAEQLQNQKTVESLRKSIDLYGESLKVWQKIGDNQQVIKILYAIASGYEGLKEPEKALAIYNQALKFQQFHKDLEGQAGTFSKIAEFYRSLKQPEKTLAAYNQALAIYNKLLVGQPQEDLMKQAYNFRTIPGLYTDLKQSGKEASIDNQPLPQSILKLREGITTHSAPLSDSLFQLSIIFKQPGKDLGRVYDVQSIQTGLAQIDSLIDTMLRLYNSTKQPQKDLSDQFAKFAGTLYNLYKQADTLVSIAEVYDKGLKKPEKALAVYNQALTVSRQLSELHRVQASSAGQVYALNSIALVYSGLKQPEKALSTYDQILKLQRTQKNLVGQLLTLNMLIKLYDDLKQPEKMNATYIQKLDVYNKLLELQQNQTDQGRQTDTLFSMGYTFFALGKLQKALSIFSQGLEQLKVTAKNLTGPDLIRNRFDQTKFLDGIGNTYRNLGNLQKGFTYEIEAQKLELGDQKDPRKAAEMLNSMSRIYIDFGKRSLALGSLDKALQLQKEVQDFAGEVETRNNIAKIYLDSGEPQKALNGYNQVLAIQQKAADVAGQAVTFRKIANLYLSLGNAQLSLDTYDRALHLTRQANAYEEQADILKDKGYLYLAMGKHNEALQAFNQSLNLNRVHSPIIFSEVGPLIGIARTYNDLKDYSKALSATRSMLEISRQINRGSVSAEIYAYGVMGEIYLSKGDYQQALVRLEQARPLVQKWKASLEAKVLDDMGQAYTSLKQYPKAIATYNLALTQARKWSDRPREAETFYLMAVTERERGDLKAARINIEGSIDVVENMRTKVIDPQLRTSYFMSVQKYYEFYIGLLMRLHKQYPSQGFNALALHVVERSKARSLLDLLQESHADIRQGVDPKLLEREENLQFQLNAFDKRRIELYSKKTTNQQVDGFEREYNAVLSQYQDIKTQIRSNSPRYAALTQPKPLKTSEIQQQVLDNNTLVLEYFVGKDRSYLWSVTKTSITSYELPKQAEIEAASEKFRKVLSNPNAQQAEIIQAGKPLTQILLSPIASQLGQKRLLIVSNGALQYLPFTALLNLKDSQPLLVNHEIVNLPSASTLATLRQELNGRKPAPKTVAMFADPVFSPTDDRVGNKKRQSDDSAAQKNSIPEPFSMETLRGATEEAGLNFERLRGTRQEAKNILQLLPENMQTQALDFEANKNNVLNPQLSQYRIIHFATHGILNTTRPELSAVVLSLVDRQGRAENGFLRLNDMYNVPRKLDSKIR
jgi:tetratricopeptide (TPR) repeat protein